MPTKEQREGVDILDKRQQEAVIQNCIQETDESAAHLKRIIERTRNYILAVQRIDMKKLKAKKLLNN